MIKKHYLTARSKYNYASLHLSNTVMVYYFFATIQMTIHYEINRWLRNERFTMICSSESQSQLCRDMWQCWIFHPIIVAAGQLKIIYFRNKVPHTSLHILVHGSIEFAQPEAEFEVAQFFFFSNMCAQFKKLLLFFQHQFYRWFCAQSIFFLFPISFLFWDSKLISTILAQHGRERTKDALARW